MNIKAILFDLGGVLVEWDGVTPLVRLTDGRITPEQARRFWLESPWVQRFETDLCSELEFASGVIKELGINLKPGEFIEEFSRWDRGPFEGATEILKELQEEFSLYCLSNNNKIHWKNPGIKTLLIYFSRTFVSFETGFMKPDPSAFKWVLDHIPESPAQILFLDDNQECVDAAVGLGLKARRVDGLSGVRKVVSDLRCTKNR